MSHYVYFAKVKDQEIVKIGCSSDPLRRVANLRPAGQTLMAVVPGSFEDEQTIHAKFAHLRAWTGRGRTEYFMLTSDLLAFIEALPGKVPLSRLEASTIVPLKVFLSPDVERALRNRALGDCRSVSATLERLIRIGLQSSTA